MKKEEFTKNFKYTLRNKNGRTMAQSIISFGSEEKPFPKDWKENAMVQSSLFDFKEEFLESLFDVEIEEGDELDNLTIPEGTFGEDWEKELMKFNKKQLIDFLRDSLIKMKESEIGIDTETKLKRIILILLQNSNGGLPYQSIMLSILKKETGLVDKLYKKYCSEKNELHDKTIKNFI